MDSNVLVIGLAIMVAVVIGIYLVFVIRKILKTRRMERLEREKCEKAEKEAKMLEVTRAVVTVALEMSMEPVIKDKTERIWIIDNIAYKIINGMGLASLQKSYAEFEKNDRIEHLGPYVLSIETLGAWHNKYVEIEQKKAKNTEEAKARKAREKKEKEQRWMKYLDYFKSLNRKQKEKELAWFKEKLVDGFAEDTDKKAEMVHQLEIIALE